MTPAAQQLQQGSRRHAPALVPALVRFRSIAFALLAHAARLRRRRRRETLDLADEVRGRLAQQLLADGRAVDLLARDVVKRLLAKPREVVIRLLRLLCLI
jgi:transposase InsO family protein